MPVVRIYAARFAKMVGADRRKFVERLPYLGLDMESVERDSIRVEYSPNRPDFGTDFGIARAMKGLLGKELGMPKFPVRPSGITVSVDGRLGRVRPYIACAVARGLKLDGEDVRQLISLQEDLHNGLGRRRKVVAIGLHDMDAVRPPFSYRGVGRDFRFVPLGGSRPQTISSILSETDEGRRYGGELAKGGIFPVISDSRGTVLSFPPIINGQATKVTTETKNMFIDVTSTDQRSGEDVLAIMATTLAGAGAKLGTVSVGYRQGTLVTPDLAPSKLSLDEGLIRSVLGVNLSKAEIARSLRKSRLDVRGDTVMAPRYRVDLMHPVDLAEEVALGYGVERMPPEYPASRRPGAFDPFEQYLDSAATVMAGMGMIEIMTFELTDLRSQYTDFGRTGDDRIQVSDPKSLEHAVLRDALLPSMMAVLPKNIRSDYPQRVFEIGRVYSRSKGGVAEGVHLGCLVAHSQASVTEAQSFVESLCLTMGGVQVASRKAEHWAFIDGRCAAVDAGGRRLGYVGEVRPEVIQSFGLGVPVSGFELDLAALYEQLK